jgi:transcriptional regulator with XRE-family HTH domain
MGRLSPVLALTLGSMGRTRDAEGDWAAVAQAIADRLEQLRMTQLDAASRARISPTTIRELRNNTNPRHRRPQTLAALSVALDWPAEHLSSVLHGEETRPRNSEAEDQLLKVIDSMQREIRDLHQRVTSIERRLADDA